MLFIVHVNSREWINSFFIILQSGDRLHAVEEGEGEGEEEEEGEQATLRVILGSLLKQNDDDQLVIICNVGEGERRKCPKSKSKLLLKKLNSSLSFG